MLLGGSKLAWVMLGWLAGDSATSAERVVTPGQVLAATISGRPASVTMHPLALDFPMLDPGFAASTGLKPDGRLSVLIGPVRVAGHITEAAVDLGGGVTKRRVGWAERPFLPGADAVVGPLGLAEPVVRLQLRAARPGAQSIVLPLRKLDSVGAAVIDVGGKPMQLAFAPDVARSRASAGAGVRIAEAHGGVLTGDRETVPIVFGVSRPIRTLRLARPLTIGPLGLRTLAVRTIDFGNANVIREENADPDEVTVFAGKRRPPIEDRLTLGADVLVGCSSISWNKPAKTVTLVC
jgi:hypothetical protein